MSSDNIPKVEIVNNGDASTTFTLLQPGVKSKRYFENCLFVRNTLIGSRIANSFKARLFTKHGIRTKCN